MERKTGLKRGGVGVFRGVHSDELDGVILPLTADPNGTPINDPLDAGDDWIELSAGAKGHDPRDQDAQADQLGPRLKVMVKSLAPRFSECPIDCPSLRSL